MGSATNAVPEAGAPIGSSIVVCVGDGFKRGVCNSTTPYVRSWRAKCLGRGSQNLGDTDAEAIVDDDDFAAGEAFPIDEQIDWSIRGLIELNDGAGGELQDVAHGHLAGAEFDRELDGEIEQDFQVSGGVGFHRNGSGLRWEGPGQFEGPLAVACAEARFEFGVIGQTHGDLFGAVGGELENVVGFELGELFESQFKAGPFGGDREAQIIELSIPGRRGAGGLEIGGVIDLEGLAELSDERFESFVGESDLDLFVAIAEAGFHGKCEHDGVRWRGSQE
jgi:hypothetical protein